MTDEQHARTQALIDENNRLRSELERMRAEATRVGLVAAKVLAEKYNAIEAVAGA